MPATAKASCCRPISFSTSSQMGWRLRPGARPAGAAGHCTSTPRPSMASSRMNVRQPMTAASIDMPSSALQNTTSCSDAGTSPVTKTQRNPGITIGNTVPASGLRDSMVSHGATNRPPRTDRATTAGALEVADRFAHRIPANVKSIRASTVCFTTKIRARLQPLHDSRCVPVDDDLQVARAPAEDAGAGQVQRRGLAGEPRVDLLVALARRVGREREDGLPLLDDRELIDQSLELGDEVRRDEDRPLARLPFLVGADDR